MLSAGWCSGNHTCLPRRRPEFKSGLMQVGLYTMVCVARNIMAEAIFRALEMQE